MARSCGVAFDDFAAGRGGGAGARAVGPAPGQLPAARSGRGGDHQRRAGRQALLVLGLRVAPTPRRRRRWSSRWRSPASTAASRGETRSRGPESGGRADRSADSVGAWRAAFLRAPYLRDALVACGVLSETFETAITWDRFPDFHARDAAGAPGRGRGLRRPGRGPGAARISCRFTHVYPDGPAPYFTVLAPGPARRRGRAVGRDQGGGLGRDRSTCGGTITHHHAVGRDHRPWYDRQRPDAVRRRAARGQGRARPGRRCSTRAC